MAYSYNLNRNNTPIINNNKQLQPESKLLSSSNLGPHCSRREGLRCQSTSPAIAILFFLCINVDSTLNEDLYLGYTHSCLDAQEEEERVIFQAVLDDILYGLNDDNDFKEPSPKKARQSKSVLEYVDMHGY